MSAFITEWFFTLHGAIAFFCLNILFYFFGGSVLLSILFFIYVNIYKYIFLISKAFFSVDVEGW